MRCFTLQLNQASTFNSISGVKGASPLLLADPYAGKTPKGRTFSGRRLTRVTGCEQTSLTLSNSYQSIDTQSAYRYDDDPGRGSIAGAAYDMSGGEGEDYYEGGETEEGEGGEEGEEGEE